MDVPCVVVDNGSGFIKAGFSGEYAPRAIFPTIASLPVYHGVMVVANRKPFYIGNEAVQKRGMLTLQRPIVRGRVERWEPMERIWVRPSSVTQHAHRTLKSSVTRSTPS